MRTSLKNKLIAGAAATLAVLSAQWFDLAPAALAADREAKAPADPTKDGSGVSTSPAEAKLSRYPIRGRLKAVDTSARTFTLSGVDKDRVFKTTGQTEIIRGGKPASLTEAVVGDEVGGLVERQSDGSLVALKVRFGPKTEQEKSTPPRRKPRASAPKAAEAP